MTVDKNGIPIKAGMFVELAKGINPKRAFGLKEGYQFKVEKAMMGTIRFEGMDQTWHSQFFVVAKRESNQIMKYFKYDHLPAHLQEVLKGICEVAEKMNATLPGGPEKSAGLRKLLEAKDCFVRANLEK